MKTVPAKRPLLRLLRTAIVTIAVGYLGLAVALYFRQGHLIFPGATTKGTPEAQFTVPAGAELLRLPTAQGEKIAALWAPAPGETKSTAGPLPTLLYFYGNGMCLADALDITDRFRNLGANVLAAEYLGYGQSEGHPSERGFYATADAAYEFLTGEKNVDPDRLVVVGSSLGGGVALDLASRRPVAGVITLSTFTSVADVAAPQFPHFPVRALLRHRFESREKIRKVRCPLLLIHGTEDWVIPFRMRDDLAAAAGGSVTRCDAIGAGHNNVLNDEGVLRTIGSFIQRLERRTER